MKKTYPIHFDISVPKGKSYFIRSLGLLPILIFYWFMWRHDPHTMISFIWFAVLIILVVAAVAIIIRMKNGKNFKKPKFSLYEDRLLVKDVFSNILEYPLEAFGGEVLVRRHLFEQFIDVPDMKSIHISCLEKADRQELMDALRVLVESDKNSI